GWTGREPLPCGKWDCNCTFNRQRGCCCAASDMYQIEEVTFSRIKRLWHDVSTLSSRVQELTAGVKVAFQANMDTGAATIIPGSTEHIHHRGPANPSPPSPGVFTAPVAGLYVFSNTAYSKVAKDTRIYHKVQMMKNGEVLVSVWENNREDGEDSATQVVIVEMKRGDQVYTELTAGRKLCNRLQYNAFTGHMVYPSTDE
uniref:C1q domain-containing protein n=1 Tax=Mola mola TaxID=94237 RepID=A0A3Q4BTX9_MOLML